MLKRHKLLIEIGTEELPANYLAYADDPEHDLFRKAFEHAFEELDQNKSFSLGKPRIFLTPRRIVLWIEDMKFDPQPAKKPIYGPSLKQAYDDGKPTKALLGFLSSKGADLKDAIRFEHRGKTCVGFYSRERPKPLKVFLSELLPAYLKALSFPKTMKWEDSLLRFPRPIRHALVLLDDKPVRLKLGDLVTRAQTSVFKGGDRKFHAVKGASQYFKLLAKEGVMLDAAERREWIQSKVKTETLRFKGTYWADESLLDEVSYLVEAPVCVGGSFDNAYSFLPAEVLTASLSKGQRLFSVRDKQGKHLPYYVAVLDGRANSKVVIQNISSVLRAKLQDSSYFYEEDLKGYRSTSSQGNSTSITGWREELGELLYLKGAGSMKQKVERLKRLVDALGPQWGLTGEEINVLKESILFSKVDLLSQMVGEFPQLQGIMGGIYYESAASKKNDFQQQVAQTIKEQYLPIAAESELASSRTGAALAILDKADILVSCFALGKIPSASQDPYALKRSFTGMVRTGIHHGFSISWERLVSQILQGIKGSRSIAKTPDADLTPKLKKFYIERLTAFFQNQGYTADLIQAVLVPTQDTPLEMSQKLKVLGQMQKQVTFLKTLKVVQRITNILKGAGKIESSQVRPELFREEEEKQLFDVFKENQRPIEEAILRKDYSSATNLYANAFSDILHLFFDKVLVNVDEPQVRQNRLSLLETIRSLYTNAVADLSTIKHAFDDDKSKKNDT
jgi:glycyl-tRNA synthetase beta chain